MTQPTKNSLMDRIPTKEILLSLAALAFWGGLGGFLAHYYSQPRKVEQTIEERVGLAWTLHRQFSFLPKTEIYLGDRTKNEPLVKGHSIDIWSIDKTITHPDNSCTKELVDCISIWLPREEGTYTVTIDGSRKDNPVVCKGSFFPDIKADRRFYFPENSDIRALYDGLNRDVLAYFRSHQLPPVPISANNCPEIIEELKQIIGNRVDKIYERLKNSEFKNFDKEGNRE